MDFLQPDNWAEALALKAERPDAVPLAGGTDLLVEMNFGRARPLAILDLTRVPEAAGHWTENGLVRIGAGVTYTTMIEELAADLPGLAIASRAVGSPQIRNRGTIGGNLGTASPAGDCHPPLLAAGAEVEVASHARGARTIPIGSFFLGPKRNALEPDELILAVHVPRTRGPQTFAKIGTRNAMVIAVASFAIDIDAHARTIGTGIGSAAPTPVCSPAAQDFIDGVLHERDLWESRGPLTLEETRRFGQLVAAGVSPISDVRGTAAYRKHALEVIATRALGRAWNDLARSA